ncbi:MAG: hypothetical protein ABI830_03730 [Pseudolabrys sp.]
MLSAKRDPFHTGANDGALSAGTPRFARALSAFQIVSTLLAVPVGLGSAYSIYRANFSAETTCQNLRANIVSMLDRRVDPTARHMLVRRDVVAFERTCGEVDPDATAAFKSLLEAETKAKTKPEMVAVTPDAKPAPVVHKTEPRVEPAVKAETKAAAQAKVEAKIEAKVEAKVEAKPESKVEAKITPREAASSDAAWLAAVRGALVKREPVQVPAVAPASLEARSLGELRTTIPPPVAAAAPKSEPLPLSPPAPVANAPVMRQADDGHPVPPEAIPQAQPEKRESRSRIGSLIAQIPFVGRAFER